MNQENKVQSETRDSSRRGFFRRFLHWFKRNRFAIEVAGLVIIIVLIYFWNSFFVTVHPGQRGVFYSRFFGGTQTEWTYDEGIHYKWPWNRIYLYSIRVQHEECLFEFLTSDALTVRLLVSIRYRPRTENLGVLHKEVGPGYVEKVIVPEVQAALRTLIGRHLPTEIYQTKEGLLERIMAESLLQVAERYIELDDLLIKRIELPPIVKEAIEMKLRQREIAAAYEYRLLQTEQEAARRKIEAQGVRDFQDIVAEGISEELLRWRGIEASLELAKSDNPKLLIIGARKEQLPIILNTGETFSGLPAAATQSTSAATQTSPAFQPNLNTMFNSFATDNW